MQLNRPQEIFALFAGVNSLPGVGKTLEGAVARKMGEHVIDVLRHLPVGIIDRKARPDLKQVLSGTVATFEVLVVSHQRPPPRSRRPWRVITENETGQLDLVFFHVKDNYVSRMLPQGQRRLVSGRVEHNRGRVQMAHPDHVVDPTQGESMPQIEPVYSLTAGLTARVLRRMIDTGLQRVPQLQEWIPESIMKERGWPAFDAAMREVHAPKGEEDLLPRTPQRCRLAFDELLANQLAMALVRRRQAQRVEGRAFRCDGRLVSEFRSSLPFELTGAQEEAVSQVLQDQTSQVRMLRMIQGDVGSGKTVVALMAMLHVVDCGAQAALLAPTEVLARQHQETLNKLLEPIGIEARLLLGQGRAKGRKRTIEDIASGDARIIVGTHALISEGVEYSDLGLAVIDEQHRFGVRQRMSLGAKGRSAVDIIVMTATPIPRSLAMTAYGDLEHSRITEKPKGRLPIDTRQLSIDRLGDVTARLRAAVAQGRRAYWICPLVEESEKTDIAAAEERCKALAAALPEITVELVHGKMKAGPRDAAMQRFREGEAQVLVATTVVEVGVDVSEASIIIVEHAERFGLAQLHQLRGRVGRGDIRSACLLLFETPLSGTAKARLDVLCETNDGFEIAERDLELRGQGEVLGKRQSGLPEFQLADPAEHRDLMKLARDTAIEMLGRDGVMQDEAAVNLLLCLFMRDSAVQYLASG